MSLSLKLKPLQDEHGKIVFCDTEARKYVYDRESQITTTQPYFFQEIIEGIVEPMLARGVTPNCMISGSGQLQNYNSDYPYDIHNTALTGDIVMNYSLDASQDYLILDDCLLDASELSVKIIRGRFKKILIHQCTIVNTDLTIICDSSPEIYIVDCFWENSRLSLIDDNGNPLSTKKVVSTSIDSDEDIASLRDYIKGENSGILEESANYGGLAASLALLGALTVAAVSKKSEVEDVVTK